MVGEQKKIINEAANIKIGKLAREYITKYFSNTSKQYNLKCFLNKYWCHDNLGICYPLLKEVDLTISISKQKGYNNDYGRYWTKPILEINGNHYIICSQWYEGYRGKLDNWISENPIPSLLEANISKTNVFILPKNRIKICGKCGIKTWVDKLLVTYYKGNEDFQHMLHIRRCDNCSLIYMSDGTLKMYKNASDRIDASLNFIEKDI